MSLKNMKKKKKKKKKKKTKWCKTSFDEYILIVFQAYLTRH